MSVGNNSCQEERIIRICKMWSTQVFISSTQSSGRWNTVASQRNRSIHLDSDLSIIIRRCKSGCLNAFLMSSVTQRDNRRVKPFRCSQQWARGLGGVHAASRVAVYLPTACALHACGRSFLGICVCICQSVYSLTVCVHAERHCECHC